MFLCTHTQLHLHAKGGYSITFDFIVNLHNITNKPNGSSTPFMLHGSHINSGQLVGENTPEIKFH